MQDTVECPRCGKRTIVQRNPDVFQCLNCDFQRDFSRSQLKDKSKTAYTSQPSGGYSYSSSGGGYSKAEYRKDDSEGGILGFLILMIVIALFAL
ncbi:MAG: hypothetical protein VKK42_13975 [Lyngbya sp.]|nr:hypothetical protein [Lyngbya sp.]